MIGERGRKQAAKLGIDPQRLPPGQDGGRYDTVWKAALAWGSRIPVAAARLSALGPMAILFFALAKGGMQMGDVVPLVAVAFTFEGRFITGFTPLPDARTSP